MLRKGYTAKSNYSLPNQTASHTKKKRQNLATSGRKHFVTCYFFYSNVKRTNWHGKRFTWQQGSVPTLQNTTKLNKHKH